MSPEQSNSVPLGTQDPLDTSKSIRATAFLLLLETAAPVDAGQLSSLTGLEVAQITQILDDSRASGDIRLDAQSRVVGSRGLSVTPDRHQIHLQGRTYWTWCAYDILGIFGSLKASGSARSTSPATGAPLVLEFRDGFPLTSNMVVFRPDLDSLGTCSNTYEEWCPNSNFFENVDLALDWSREHGLRGSAIGLSEATIEAAEQWRPLVENTRLPPSDTLVQRLADAIAASTLDVDERGARIVVGLYQLLADGEPVTTAAISGRSEVPEAEVVRMLRSWPGVFWDDAGRVVGFWGLAIPTMAHQFQAEDGKPIHAWCALDPFLIVPLIGRSARVESHDPVSGESISMTVTPDGVESLSPPSTTVSFVWPPGPFDKNVVQTFCNYVHYFASPASAEQWAAKHDNIVVLPVRDAVAVGRRGWARFRVAAESVGAASD